MTTVDAGTIKAVEEAARAARGTVAGLASVPDERLDDALRVMADHLGRRAAEVLEANAEDMRAARAGGVRDALLDRLRLDDARLEAIAGQLRALAGVPAEPSRRTIRELPGGLLLEECRRPVGVIGANFEARPNVVVDIASQFVKSRNAGVLRTGSAAIAFGHRAGGRGHRARSRPGRARPRDDPAGPRARAGLRPGAGQPARPDPAGHPARQRGQHPRPGRRGGPARRADHGARRRRRGLVPGRGGRPGPVRAADRSQPGPARRVQPAEPAARPPGPVGVAGAADRRAAGPAGHRGVAAPARPPARPRVGAGRRARGDGDDRPRRRSRAPPP